MNNFTCIKLSIEFIHAFSILGNAESDECEVFNVTAKCIASLVAAPK